MSESSRPKNSNSWNARLPGWTSFRSAREDQVFLVLAVVIAVLTAVVAFIVLTEREGMRLYPAGHASWRRMAIPFLASLGMGYLLYRHFPDARGSGVPQTKAALFARGGVITLRTVVGKFLCTSASQRNPFGARGTRGSMGRRYCLGAGSALGIASRKREGPHSVGTAAAIAAAFNTPLAAVLFSLEEIMGDLNAPVLGSVVLASATSWLILRLFLGNHPLFKVPQYQLVHPVEFVGLRSIGCGWCSGFRSVYKTLAQYV